MDAILFHMNRTTDLSAADARFFDAVKATVQYIAQGSPYKEYTVTKLYFVCGENDRWSLVCTLMPPYSDEPTEGKTGEGASAGAAAAATPYVRLEMCDGGQGLAVLNVTTAGDFDRYILHGQAPEVVWISKTTAADDDTAPPLALKQLLEFVVDAGMHRYAFVGGGAGRSWAVGTHPLRWYVDLMEQLEKAWLLGSEGLGVALLREAMRWYLGKSSNPPTGYPKDIAEATDEEVKAACRPGDYL